MKNQEEIRQELLKEKEHLVAELASYKGEDPYLASDRDLEVHSIDNDSIQNEAHDRIEGIRTSLKESLSLVLKALEKMDQGTYGKCEKCGKQIEPERLEASPTAAYCLEHAT